MFVLLGAAIAAMLLAALLTLTTHAVLPNRRTAASPAPSPAHPSASEDRRRPATLLPADATTASTAELCRAWRVSYPMLANVRDPVQLAEVAAMRRRYLDELDRRDPHGFRRWLDEGARAASDPARYIRTSSSSPNGKTTLQHAPHGLRAPLRWSCRGRGSRCRGRRRSSRSPTHRRVHR